MDDLKAVIDKAIHFQNLGQTHKAEIIYKQVLDIEPHHADALNLLGSVFISKGKYFEAIELIGKAIIECPTEADYYSNFAVAKLALRDPVEAITHTMKAIELKPNHPNAQYNLGNALFATGRVEEAVIHFRKAIEIDPSNGHFWTNYLFALNFSPTSNQQTIYEENKRWGTNLHTVQKKTYPTTNNIDPNRRLRIAYYLPEWDQHVTIKFLLAILSHHNREQFEVQIYGHSITDVRPPKFFPERDIKWKNTHGKTISQVADMMHSNSIDILIHPCTFKARYRELLTYRIAPIQLAAINLVSTTGLKNTTHLMTTAFLSPVGKSESYFGEKLVRLKNFNVYQVPEHFPDVEPLPALANENFVFASFNNPAKLNATCIKLWAGILKETPSSRLLLKHKSFENQALREYFSKAFSTLTSQHNQLIFSGYTKNRSEYLAAYGQVDLCLDPIPFGGGTTTYESILMGVPVLTLVNGTIMGRLTGSIMINLNLPEFLTHSEKDYVLNAISFSRKRSYLSKIRAQIRGKALKTIFNGKLFTRDFEESLRKLWVSHCHES